MGRQLTEIQKKIYAILFALLVLATFVHLNNEFGIVGGSIVQEVMLETWHISCDTPDQTAQEYVLKSGCGVDACTHLISKQPFIVGDLKIIPSPHCAADEFGKLVMACDNYYTSYCPQQTLTSIF